MNIGSRAGTGSRCGRLGSVPPTARRGPGRPPSAKSTDTRGRILQTAREVFGELGYDAATFQEIALRSDLTRPAINHYFPDKRTLYRHVVEQTNELVIAAGVAKAEQESTLASRMRAFVRAAVQAQSRDRASAAFLVTSALESQRHPELSPDGNHSLEATRAFLVWALADARDAGELHPDTDVDVAADTLMAMLWGLGFYAGFVGSHERVAAIAEEFLRMLHGQAFLPGG